MNATHLFFLALSLFAVLWSLPASAQPQGYNYDEAKVPKFELPDPLVTTAGKPVATKEAWETQRRPELIKLFEDHVYGACPAPPKDIRFEVFEESNDALGGKAIRKQVAIHLGAADPGESSRKHRIDLLIYLPKGAKKPTPMFLGCNFSGNQACQDDPAIRMTESWVPNRKGRGKDNRATEASRGAASSRWPAEEVIARGYGIATIYCGDVEPDHANGHKDGVRSTYPVGSKEIEDGDWGGIAAWGWGLSRALDYFATDDAIDHERTAVIGHSRLGKTALWAGARDERFAIVISNNSGCGGAALHRRAFGETVKRINTSFPHWFCGTFKNYNDNEQECPVDQHQLIALIAPRPVYVASATEDRWADPRGEFLSCLHADPVYRLLTDEGLPAKEWPAADEPVSGRIGYHLRTGKHDITSYDWKRYMDFADKHYAR